MVQGINIFFVFVVKNGDALSKDLQKLSTIYFHY